jgi:hypothetical protein
LIAAFALELETKARVAPRFTQYPVTRCERWIVTDVLKVTTVERGAPVPFVVRFEADDLSFH